MNPTPKKFIFGKIARVKLKEGVDRLADAVSCAMGPQGCTFSLPSIWNPSIRESDGISIADSITLKDPYANMGILMGREMARNIKDASGDGTKTGIILLRSLIKEGMSHILSGVHPMMIKYGMERALDRVLSVIDALSTPVEGAEAIKSIATVSAFGDQEIGNVISEVIDQIGKSGVMIIEEGMGIETEIEVLEGLQLKCGYASPYFCTDAQAMRVEMKHTALLVIDGKLSTLQDILKVLENVASRMQPLLIIAEDIESNALSTLVMNKLHGIMKVVAVKVLSFENGRKAILEDIAVLTGATVICESKGMNLRDTSIDMLGEIEQLRIDKDTTIIVNHPPRKNAITLHLRQIKRGKKDAQSDEKRKKLNEQKNKLSNDIAIIRVGAPKQSEMQRKKQIFEKSAHATRVAQESGCVPGGGIALLHASQILNRMTPSPDEKVGHEIMARACMSPFKQMVKSCGKDDAGNFKHMLSQTSSMRLNALSEKVKNLGAPEIIDPTKVVKNALKFAVSTANMILLSEVLVTDEFEEEKPSS